MVAWVAAGEDADVFEFVSTLLYSLRDSAAREHALSDRRARVDARCGSNVVAVSSVICVKIHDS